MRNIITPTRKEIERYSAKGLMRISLRGFALRDLEKSFINLTDIDSPPAYFWQRGEVDLSGCATARVYIASQRFAHANLQKISGLNPTRIEERLTFLYIDVEDTSKYTADFKPIFKWTLFPVYVPEKNKK